MEKDSIGKYSQGTTYNFFTFTGATQTNIHLHTPSHIGTQPHMHKQALHTTVRTHTPPFTLTHTHTQTHKRTYTYTHPHT